MDEDGEGDNDDRRGDNNRNGTNTGNGNQREKMVMQAATTLMMTSMMTPMVVPAEGYDKNLNLLLLKYSGSTINRILV